MGCDLPLRLHAFLCLFHAYSNGNYYAYSYDYSSAYSKPTRISFTKSYDIVHDLLRRLAYDVVLKAHDMMLGGPARPPLYAVVASSRHRLRSCGIVFLCILGRNFMGFNSFFKPEGNGAPPYLQSRSRKLEIWRLRATDLI